MAVEADKVVVTIQANVDQYNAAIRGAAKAFDQATSKIESAANRAEAGVSRAMARIGQSADKNIKSAAQSAEVFQAAYQRLEATTHGVIAAVDASYAALGRLGLTQQVLSKALDEGIITQERYNSTLAAYQALAASTVAVSGDVTQAFIRQGITVKSASESADVFTAAYNRLEGEVSGLIGSVNPAYAALERLGAAQKTLAAALSEGIITQERYDQVLSTFTAEAELAKTATERFGAGAALAGQRSRLLGYQIADIGVQLSSGTNPFIIIAQQAPQVSNALEGTAGVAGRMATFFSGPWGAAILASASVLGVLISKLYESSDATDAHKKASLSLEDALSKQAFATDEARKAIDDYNDAQERARHQDSLAAEESLRLAKARLQEAIATREAAKADLEKALANPNPVVDPATGIAGPDPRGIADAGRIQALDKSISETRQAIRNLNIEVGKVTAKAASDPIAAINLKYDNMADAAERAAKGNDKLADSIGNTLAAIEKQRSIELENERKRQRAAREDDSSNQQFGRTITSAQAVEIARGAGFQVNSSDRSYAEQKRIYDAWVAAGKPSDNPVARPGKSAHNRGQAIDIQIGPGVTVAAIRKAFTEEGVRLSRVFKERGHYHVEFATDKSGAAAQRDADEAERKRQAAADKAARDAAAFADLTARVDAKALDLKRAQATSIEDVAKLDEDRVDAEAANLKADIDQGVALRRWTEAQAKALKLKVDQNAIDEKALIEGQKAVALIQQRVQTDEARIANERDVLSAQLDIASSTSERRDIALRLVDLAIERERIELQGVIDAGKLATATDEQRKAAERATERLNSLDQIQAYTRRATAEQNAGPLQDYVNKLNKSGTTGAIQDQVEGYVVDEIESVRSALHDGIEKAIGTKDPLINGLIDILLQQLILRPLANALSNANSGGGGFLGTLFGGFTSLLGGGGGGSTSISALKGLGLGFASGTNYAPGGFAMVGEHGPEIVNLPKGAQVIPNHQLGNAAIPAQQVVVQQTVVLDARGAITTKEFVAGVNGQMRELAGQARDDAVSTARRQAPGAIGTANRYGTVR